MRRLVSTLVVAGTAALGVGCRQGGAHERDSVSRSGSTAAHAWNPSAWRAPTVAELPNDSLGSAVRRGLALVTATADSLPRFAASNLSCTSCHLDEGRRGTAAPLSGVFARYPKYIERTGAVVPIEDRVNYCMTRSLAGSRLPNDSREMQDIVAYLAFMARGVPIGAHLAVEGMPAMPKDAGDTTRGGTVYRDACARRWLGRNARHHSSGTTCPSTNRARSVTARRTTSPPSLPRSRDLTCPTRHTIGRSAALPPTCRMTPRVTKPSGPRPSCLAGTRQMRSCRRRVRSSDSGRESESADPSLRSG